MSKDKLDLIRLLGFNLIRSNVEQVRVVFRFFGIFYLSFFLCVRLIPTCAYWGFVVCCMYGICVLVRVYACMCACLCVFVCA